VLVSNTLNPALMKNTVKSLVLLTISTLFFNFSFAQLKMPLTTGIGNDMKKVIEDFPNRFINLMGEVISQHPQSTDYECNFKVNGAEESFITRYSAKKEVCSFEAVMLRTENFNKAKQKFRSLFNQLNNLSVRVADNSTVRLRGVYEEPREEMKFSSVLLSPEPGYEVLKKMKIEIVMLATEPMEWKVKVLIYDREREDDERGAVRE
jgi:hypothetical protein